MFEHYHAQPSGDADRPPPLVVRLESLGTAVLRSLPQYLIDSLPLRHDLSGIETHLDARPVLFKVGGESVFSERAIWALLIEMPDGATNVVKYVDAVLDYSDSNDDLALYSHLDVIGQDPLYAYIDRYLRRAWLESPPDLDACLNVTDCFLRFLRRCDMDHETFQDENIELVLRFLKQRDKQQFIDLLVFRLSTGQNRELSADQYGLLESDGVLKSVIDGILPIIDSGWPLRVAILRLCYAVYGSSAKLTGDVLAYYRDKVDLGERHDLRNFQREFQLIPEQRDSIWKRWQRNLNTGFHRYDKKERQWSQVI